MSEWLVTVCVGGAYTYGPAVIVEAASYAEAAHVGVEELRKEDSTYGVECRECENIAVDRVAVLPMEQARLFGQTPQWGEVK